MSCLPSAVAGQRRIVLTTSACGTEPSATITGTRTSGDCGIGSATPDALVTALDENGWSAEAISAALPNRSSGRFASALAMIASIIPATQYSGLLDPVSSMDGVGRFIGSVYPAAHFIDISRGVFNKGLQFADLSGSLRALALAVPVILLLAIALLKKQER